MYVNDSLPEEKAKELKELKEVKIGAVAQARVNLMGDHTDYNEGFVLPIAIRASTKVTVVLSPGLVVTLMSSGGRVYKYELGDEKPTTT